MSYANDWSETLGLYEAARTTEHAQIVASNLEGWEIGAAFIISVILDPKVQACGAWLCFEHPEFSELFRTGVFEGIRRGSLHRDPVILGKSWPVVLDENELCRDFELVASRGDYDNTQAHPVTRSKSIPFTAYVVADRHAAFFDLLRESKLIAPGLSLRDGRFDVRLTGGNIKLRLPPAPKLALHSASGTIGSGSVAKTVPLKDVRPKKVPLKRAAVIKALRGRRIKSKSALDAIESPSRFAAEIAGDIKDWGTSRDRVEALRVMFTRLTEADFAVK